MIETDVTPTATSTVGAPASSPAGAMAGSTAGATAAHEQAFTERRLNGVALAGVLGALLLTLLLEALDQTVVGTALPRIIASLHGFDRYTWAVIAYTLASTTVVPVAGSLSDQFGRKWFVVVGVLLFLAGSVACGTAQTMNQLIAFRALQGLGAGIGIGLSFTVVADIFPPRERARWGGLFGAVYGVSNLVGPTLGGWLTDHGPLLGGLVTTDARWRWVFYVNVPIGVIALVGLLIWLPRTLSARTTTRTGWAAVRRIDLVGALLAAGATTCLVLGLTWGSNATYAWGSVPVVGALAAAVVLLAAFILAERVVAEPIVPLDLFTNRIFAPAAALSLVTLMALIGLVIYLPLYLQGVLGESATNSGELITPLTLSSVVGAMAGALLINRLNGYRAIIIVGAVLLTVGTFLLTRMTPSTSLLFASVAMVIAGLGMGPFFSVLTLVAQNSLPPQRLGVGTSAIRYLGQLGAVLGVAVVGTVVNHTIADDSLRRLPADAVRLLTPAGVKAVTNPQVLVSASTRDEVTRQALRFTRQAVAAHTPPGAQQAIAIAHAEQQTRALLGVIFHDLTLSLNVAIQNGFLAVLAFCVVTLISAFFLKDVAPLPPSHGEAEAAAAAVPALA